MTNLDLLDPSNIAPWCSVPYDTVTRSPEERADMLARLGLSHFAWDWRVDHLAKFPQQLDVFGDRGIELIGIWAPHILPTEGDGGLGAIDPALQEHIDIAASRSITPMLWACTEFGPPGPVKPFAPQTHRATVERTAEHLAPLASEAARHGMDVAIYPHLGWAGEPANVIEVIEALRSAGHSNVGMVYHVHHGHAHLDDFPAQFTLMKPYLRAFGINGTRSEAQWGDGKILPVGHGDRDLELVRIVVESGWRGPITLLSHTMDDAEVRLRDNLEGLEWLREVLAAEATGAPPPAGPPRARIPHPVWPH